MATRLSALPSVERVLSDPRIARLIESSSRDTVAGLVRERIAAARETALNGAELPSYDAIIVDIEHHSKSRWEQWPHSVINATGVILHTNLGRAPLSKESLDAIQAVAGSYTDLEFDLDEGKRGGRNTRVSSLLRQLSGAEAAFAVGNNAAAVTLGLASVAAGKQVIVSRGEAVEIGGGFRIPDVLRQSGAELVEVGTTNRTYARDYERAITGNTGAILTVHSSNFRVVGFVHAPTLAELVEIGRKRNVPVLHDLGSGCFLDTTRFGLAREPRPQDSIAAGVDMAFFSGDKLL
ncbi:MAG: L-seryl-tRNA(Sec) selenium transferase, partial [SAR202 cluster bacterium]|nr:L-seryl-tRNA(Sec) selenium transferase [SAR202 cluster bacterium]